jgi:hypothetical protein
VSCPVCKEPNKKLFAQIEDKDYFRCEICRAIFIDERHYLSSADEKKRYSQHNNGVYDKKYRKFLSKLYDPMVQKNKFFVDVYDPYFFPDESFLNKKYKFVTCSEAAEHFYNPFEEFNKINEILEEGGWLGVMTNFFDESINFEDWYYRKDPTHVCFYSEETFKVIASQKSWSYEIPSKDIVLFKKN